MSAFASTSQQSNLDQVLRGFAAGGFAAVVSKTTVAPIDRVKLILQLQARPLDSPSTSQYSGITDCLRKLCAEQGVTSLWRGNCATLARSFPAHALNFVLRDYYRVLFLNAVDRKQNFNKFVLGNVAAGGAGAATALCFLYPLDLARTRLAVEVDSRGNRRHRGVFQCLRHVASHDGPGGLYRGFVCSMQFVVISRAVFFGMFDTARFSINDDPKQTNFFITWMLAQTCVVLSAFLTYPMDTVRRHLMMDSGVKERSFHSTVDCLVQTVGRDGWSGLYRGALTNSIRATSGALMVALYYEAMKHM